ncbi:ATP/GTP-binding protein [Roseibium sp. Sym1]|uniref:ATP/GTP-binding protein n=1 Tax=Roseibium sp. Sym1 TaxID=3016006 RepID=UPI0022B2FD44|nr:ATP-binding protein [Roseibium sp. Sym1]
MKIALTGAHGTGKTTLTDTLHKSLSESYNTKVCREVPRVIIEAVGQDEFFRRGNNTPLRQCIVFLYQILEDHFKGLEAEILISDRTIIDHLAYMLDLFPEFQNEPEYKPIHKMIEQWMTTYDLIFKVPIEFQVKDDGVRESDLNFQQKIDKKIDELYINFGISPKIISGSVDMRTKLVLDEVLPQMRLKKST